MIEEVYVVKTKANALTSVAFSEYIQEVDINEFYITGADATACVKSTCFNRTKAGYNVHVISDCVTSYDLKKWMKCSAIMRLRDVRLRHWRSTKILVLLMERIEE